MSFFQKFLGVEGGVLLKGKYFRALGEKYTTFKHMNNALFVAPAFKWGLAIVPLIGAIEGRPPVDQIDEMQAMSLSVSGLIWSYYGFLVRPTAYLLVAVNLALLGANGNNVYRKLKWNSENKPKAATSASS